MYSIDCEYYNKEFYTLNDLIENIIETGQDPNYEVIKDGKGVGEEAIDFIVK